MKIPFEEDLIRYFGVRGRVRQRQANIKMQLGYCTSLMDSKCRPLTTEEQEAIAKQWESISFAYPVNAEWHQHYANKTGIFDARYVPNELHYYFVERKFINFEYLRAFTDKNYYSVLFPNVKQPTVVIKKICGYYYKNDFERISLDEAVSLCEAAYEKGIVIKPSIHSWGGRNIVFLRKGDKSKEQLKQFLIDFGNNYVVQEIFKQHPDLAKIHSESVNTMRIITMLLNGKVEVLSACLRMGVGKSQVDNFSQGGVGCGIEASGRLKPVGYDRYGKKVLVHPDGFKFENCVVPSFDKVIETIKTAQMRVPQFGVASWDFTVDEMGDPVFIEYNIGQGGIDIHQYNNGPLYGDKTEEVIKKVFKDYSVQDATLFYNYNVFQDHVTLSKGSTSVPVLRVHSHHHNQPVTRIGREAFSNARHLKKIVLPPTLQYIDYCAFHNCIQLRNMKLPDSLLVIGRSAFNGCINLKQVKIPKGATSIGILAFKDCKNLKRVEIPNSVTNISGDAFSGCDLLTIQGERGSYAEQYAISHRIKFLAK